jgi:hypothetical protein
MGFVCGFRLRGKTMTSAVAALGIAVAATSALCYALLTRAGKFRRNRWPAGDNAADGGSSSGSEGWAAASWFGGHHSATDSLATQAISAAAIAAAEVAAAIDAIGRSEKAQDFDLTQQDYFGFDPKWLGGQFGIA